MEHWYKRCSKVENVWTLSVFIIHFTFHQVPHGMKICCLTSFLCYHDWAASLLAADFFFFLSHSLGATQYFRDKMDEDFPNKLKICTLKIISLYLMSAVWKCNINKIILSEASYSQKMYHGMLYIWDIYN